jgi:hypothetical protein
MNLDEFDRAMAKWGDQIVSFGLGWICFWAVAVLGFGLGWLIFEGLLLLAD